MSDRTNEANFNYIYCVDTTIYLRPLFIALDLAFNCDTMIVEEEAAAAE